MQSYDLRNAHTSSLTSRLSDGDRGGAPCHAVYADLSRDRIRERPRILKMKKEDKNIQGIKIDLEVREQ
jgi:hypothetical protein